MTSQAGDSSLRIGEAALSAASPPDFGRGSGRAALKKKLILAFALNGSSPQSTLPALLGGCETDEVQMGDLPLNG